MQPIYLLFLAFLSIAITLNTLTYAEEVSTPAGVTVDELKAKENAFLLEVAQRPNIYKLKSGMLVEILASGDKPEAKSPLPDDDSDVTYTGYFMDGKKFDPANTVFTPNESMIKGWKEVMQYMVEGDKWKLYLPHNLAYGENGFFSIIPPYSTIIFEFEMIEVAHQGGKPAAVARKMFQDALVLRSGNQEL